MRMRLDLGSRIIEMRDNQRIIQMTNRRTLLGYAAVAAVLVVASLCIENNTGIAARSAEWNHHAVDDRSERYLHSMSLALIDPLPEDTTDRNTLPAEKVYKNITTLKGMTAGELMNSMTFISAALGVRCSFCHVQGDFASDDKPTKKTARGMMHMTEEINAKNFGGGESVTCHTCHRGSAHPLGVPTLAQGPWLGLDVGKPHDIKRDSTTTVDAVLAKYVQALGGEAALAKIKSRVTKASESQSWGSSATLELFQAAPNLMRSTSVSSDPKRGAYVLVNGARGTWAMFSNRPASPLSGSDLEQVIRMAELFPAVDLKRFYGSVELLGKERVGDRDLYVISASRSDKSSDRLYFDAGTGLLIRRYVEYRTPLGLIPLSIEYSDYREIDNVRVPYVVKWTTPRESWTDTITQIRHNIEIGDTMFVKPR